MADTPTTDPHLAETQLIYDEYRDARTSWEADPGNPLTKARFDRAQTALHEVRDFWRLVGAAVGDRNENGGGIRVADNETTSPTLLPLEA